jgi:hypothetical protein
MDVKRDETATVGITLRVREDLRQHLETSAKARRVSLNQEIIDRLEHARDRQGLLREVMELTYGPRLGGVLMVLAMGMIGAGYVEARRQAGWPPYDPDWLDDPNAFDAAAGVAMGLLFALRPLSEAPSAVPEERGKEQAADMLGALADAIRRGPDLPSEGPYGNPPPLHDTKIAHALLGPLVERLTEARVKDAQRFVEAVPADQPKGSARPTGAKLPGEPASPRDGGSVREQSMSNPVITLTHKERGPMRVYANDEVSWWERKRMWIEAVPRDAASGRLGLTNVRKVRKKRSK